MSSGHAMVLQIGHFVILGCALLVWLLACVVFACKAPAGPIRRKVYVSLLLWGLAVAVLVGVVLYARPYIEHGNRAAVQALSIVAYGVSLMLYSLDFLRGGGVVHMPLRRVLWPGAESPTATQIEEAARKEEGKRRLVLGACLSLLITIEGVIIYLLFRRVSYPF